MDLPNKEDTMTIAFHGSHNGNQSIHSGLCLTESIEAAVDYAASGCISMVRVDTLGLTVADVEGYDNDSNTAPGDDGNARGADVLTYEDATEFGRSHDTIRLMSPAALASVVVLATMDMEWWSAGEDMGIPESQRWSWYIEQSAIYEDAYDCLNA